MNNNISTNQITNPSDNNKESNPKKAVVLLSGGLDSTIATHLMKKQGIELTALNFHTAFCTCTKSGCKFESKSVSKEVDIPLKIMSVTKEYLQVIRHPKYGYGRGMNPCIDCRIFMFKKAKEYMDETGASFVITGEIKGQRPMSQTNNSMYLIEKESGLEGRILRPLSVSKETNLSEDVKQMIDLESLPNISGRSRKIQYQLVEDLDIENYSCPSGGCLLTETEFSHRLKDYFQYNKENNLNEIKLLKIGRHFRINDDSKLIVARDEKENYKLTHFKSLGTFFEPISKGPSALLISKNQDIPMLEHAGKIIARYCKGENIIINYQNKDTNGNITVIPFPKEEVDKYLIR